MQRKILIIISILFVFVSVSAHAWGPTGHALVTTYAIELLPADMKPFYEANSRYLVALSTLPDDWKQTHREIGNQHFIDLDLLSQPPFSDLIMEQTAAEKKFGAEKIQEAGVLPWVIEERFNRLVDAFKKGNSEQVFIQSVVLAHYTADAHVPFHTTKYYDGKTPAQKGIHNRWEEILPALMLKSEAVRPIKPEQVDSVLKSAFGWCIESYGLIDPILSADDKAREHDPGLAYSYYKAMYKDTGPTLQQQLAKSTEAVAGVYIAAWNRAGKPSLPDKTAPIMWEAGN